MSEPSAARSAFAAAVFSFLFPGLGQAYLGMWSRALAWAALPILSIALGAGMLANAAARKTVEGFAFQPDILLLGIGLLVVDLVYRLACVIDAFRLARRTGDPSSRLGVVSLAGLVAVFAVLVVSHIAIARPLMIARDSICDITSCDEEPVEPVAPGVGASFVAPFTPPPSPAPDPAGTEPPMVPTATPGPTPTQGPSWTEGGRLNILLIGADAGRAGYDSYLTDTMIVVSIDPQTKQTAFITMPRDMVGLPIPRDWGAYRAWGGAFGTKANSIYTYAARLNPDQYPGPSKNKGFNAMKGILGETLGLSIDYFVAVDLRSFREIINDLGGVVIDVQNPVYDTHYAADDGSGHWKLYIPPGLRYMQGQEALAYGRARHETSDFDRGTRQQNLITSIRRQVDLPSLLAPGKIQSLLATFRSSVKTDIPPDRIPALIQLAQEIDLERRISLPLDPPVYGTTCQPPDCELYVIKADVPRMRKAVANVFSKDRGDVERASELASEGAVVHVLNGTPGSNLKTTRIADALDSLGVNAVVPPIDGGAAASSDFTDTVVTVYHGAEAAMPTTIAYLERLFSVTAVTADDPGQEADIVIIVGTGTPAIKG